jgi:ATP adenylyltransferase
MAYIMMNDRNEECIFCNAFDQTDGPDNLIIYRGQKAYVILNRYPYTSGHLMVVPIDHYTSLEDSNQDTRLEMMELITQCIKVLRSIYQPEGFNLGANIGDAAGAGIPKHFHMHVVPRWIGDTNFMSTLGGTRVIPEALLITYRRLKNAWKALEFDG